MTILDVLDGCVLPADVREQRVADVFDLLCRESGFDLAGYLAQSLGCLSKIVLELSHDGWLARMAKGCLILIENGLSLDVSMQVAADAGDLHSICFRW